MTDLAVMSQHMLDPTPANPGPKKKKRNKISQVISDDPEQPLAEDQGREQMLQASTTPPPVNPVDEIPIPKAGPKSFEELLAQELAKEGAKRAEPEKSNRATPSQATFLKRGTGTGAALARADADKRKSLGKGSSVKREPLSVSTNRKNQDTRLSDLNSVPRQDAENVSEISDFGSTAQQEGQTTGKPTARQVARKLNIDMQAPDSELAVVSGRPFSARDSRDSERSTEEMMPISSLRRHHSMPLSSQQHGGMYDELESHRRGAFADDECEIDLDGREGGGQLGSGLRDDARGEEDTEDEELREFESLERKVSEVFQGSDAAASRGDSSRARGHSEHDSVLDPRGGRFSADEAAPAVARQSRASGSRSSEIAHDIAFDEEEAWEDDPGVEAAAQRRAGSWEAEGASLRGGEGGVRGRQERESEGREGETSQPQGSLVSKLFHKEQKRQPAKGRAAAGPGGKVAGEGGAQGAGEAGKCVSEAEVDKRMEELDAEVKEFRRQNRLLEQLRKEAEAERAEVQEEKSKLAAQWEEAEERFERYREAEMRKVKKERKETDRHLALCQAQVKDLTAERDALKQEVQVTQEDCGRREKRLRGEVERLKKKLEDAQGRAEELARELKFSEEARLAMQDRERLQQMQRQRSREELGGGDAERGRVPDGRAAGGRGGGGGGVGPVMTLSPPERDALAARIAGRAVGNEEEEHEEEDAEEEDAGGAGMENVLGSLAAASVRGGEEGAAGGGELEASSSLNIDGTTITDNTLEIDAQSKPQRGAGAVRDPAEEVVSETRRGDGKIERTFADGRKLLIFSNGTKKEVFPDGGSLVHFSNKDVKHAFPDGRVVYFYSETQTTHTTFADGLEVFEFSNRQQEKHFPDGSKEILFPDGTLKFIHQNKEEESIFPDGTVQRILRDGTRVIEFTNGLRETVHPNGTKARDSIAPRDRPAREGGGGSTVGK